MPDIPEGRRQCPGQPEALLAVQPPASLQEAALGLVVVSNLNMRSRLLNLPKGDAFW